MNIYFLKNNSWNKIDEQELYKFVGKKLFVSLRFENSKSSYWYWYSIIDNYSFYKSGIMSSFFEKTYYWKDKKLS